LYRNLRHVLPPLHDGSLWPIPRPSKWWSVPGASSLDPLGMPLAYHASTNPVKHAPHQRPLSWPGQDEAFSDSAVSPYLRGISGTTGCLYPSFNVGGPVKTSILPRFTHNRPQTTP
jgi:hypothetical protein